ncbi:unnamed protein product, partial [marine sediment metagenome]
NRRYLELAVDYNEDDCRATKVVREWVAGNGGRTIGSPIGGEGQDRR